MSHIPNIHSREAFLLGHVGTLGINDSASPDNDMWPMRTPGTVDLGNAADIDDGASALAEVSGDDAQAAVMCEICRGQEILAEQSFGLPPTAGMPTKLTQKDFELAAGALKCEVAAIKAVAEVESRGGGFLPDSRPKILFEAHHFSRLTAHAYDQTHPLISSPKWKPELYLGGAQEYERLDEAMGLEVMPALQSASWGMFQIMGFNYRDAGFLLPEEFVAAMYTNEGAHLKAFVSFLRERQLAKHIQSKNWEAFAAGYNGPGFKKNQYDTKLAQAYAKHAASAKPASGKR